MELPKPASVNFYEMTAKEQNRYYQRNVRGMITWLLQQKDFPAKFRPALETIDDYTYYLGEEVGVDFFLQNNLLCEDDSCGCEGCDGVCNCVEEPIVTEDWHLQEPLED